MATHSKRPLRVAIAGFKLESVTFLPNLTTLADFQAVEVRGNDLIERVRRAGRPRPRIRIADQRQLGRVRGVHGIQRR